MEGMMEGYVLTGRHGFLSTYESFVRQQSPNSKSES